MSLWGEVFAFYKDACCHRLFVYVVVNCRDVAFHKNHPEMVSLHFIRVFCFVRTFNKRIRVVHAFHKPYSFMKCPRSHPPGIRRGILFLHLYIVYNSYSIIGYWRRSAASIDCGLFVFVSRHACIGVHWNCEQNLCTSRSHLPKTSDQQVLVLIALHKDYYTVYRFIKNKPIQICQFDYQIKKHEAPWNIIKHHGTSLNNESYETTLNNAKNIMKHHLKNIAKHHETHPITSSRGIWRAWTSTWTLKHLQRHAHAESPKNELLPQKG